MVEGTPDELKGEPRGDAVHDLLNRYAVVGTVLGEAMFGALRRLAHAEASARAYEDGAPGGGAPEEAGGEAEAARA